MCASQSIIGSGIPMSMAMFRCCFVFWVTILLLCLFYHFRFAFKLDITIEEQTNWKKLIDLCSEHVFKRWFAWSLLRCYFFLLLFVLFRLPFNVFFAVLPTKYVCIWAIAIDDAELTLFVLGESFIRVFRIALQWLEGLFDLTKTGWIANSSILLSFITFDFIM